MEMVQLYTVLLEGNLKTHLPNTVYLTDLPQFSWMNLQNKAQEKQSLFINKQWWLLEQQEAEILKA